MSQFQLKKKGAYILVRFIAAYFLLTFPWPGWDHVYGKCFRGMASVFYHDNDERELAFKTPGDGSARPQDTRIEIANRALLHPDGSGPVRNLDIDARAFAWEPTALLIALIVATPLPWRRLRWVALVGIPALQLILLMLLGYFIWNESAAIGLVTLSPFWASVGSNFRGAIIEQFGIALPLVIWVLVTFRRQDLDEIRKLAT